MLESRTVPRVSPQGQRFPKDTLFRTLRWCGWVVAIGLILIGWLVGCGRAELDVDNPMTAAADAAVDGAGNASDGSAIDAGPVISLSVSPAVANLAVGTQGRFVATAILADGSTSDVSALAAWSTSDSAIANVAAGLVSALKPGTATITAKIGSISGSASITVPAATVASLAVTPGKATTGLSGTVAFHAVLTLTDGSTQDVTSTAAWTSSSTQIATIASTGVATGVAAGQAVITATVGAFQGTASLTVNGASLASIALTPTSPVVGARVTFPFAATGTYSDGSIADVTSTATWISSSPGIVSITSAGVATTLSAGKSDVTAKVGNITGSTTVTVTAATLQSIAVTPASSTLAIHGNVALMATGTYSDNTTFDLTSTVTWASSAASIAAVSNAAGSAGTVTAIAAGSATITASTGGISGVASITVSPATLSSIAITPANPSVPIRTDLPLTATGTYSDGSLIDITTTASWSSDESHIASISNASGSNGVVTGNALGTTTIHVTLSGVSATTSVTVTSAAVVSIALSPASVNLVQQEKQPMGAIATYSDGTTLDVTTTAVWTTGNTAIASVSNAAGAQGLLTAIASGSTTVAATFSGKSGSANVTVSTPILAQIVVSPIAATSPAGQRVPYQATAIFSNNTQQNVTRQATWSSSDTAVATIGAQGGGGPGGGQVTASTLATGTTTITAKYQGISGSATLTVTSATVIDLQISPVTASFAVGTNQPFQATAIYSDNTSSNVTMRATWQSSNPAVVGVTTGGFGGRGVATGVAQGSAQITASFSGFSASASVVVTAAVVTSISISPATFTGAVGEQQQFSAQAIYSDGTSRDITGGATWISSNPSVVGVNDAAGGPGGGNKGLATGLQAGTATISASYSGLTGTASFTVTSATLQSIQINPPQPSVAAGVPVQFQATAIYSDNTSKSVTNLATWTSSIVSVGAVSDAPGSRGLAQTLAAGTTTITATWSGKSGTALLTVSAATLSTIQITPFQPTIPIGFTTNLVATGIFSDNTTQDLTSLATWTSSAPAVAAVSASGATKGRLTPITAGTATISATYNGVTGTDAVTVSNATLQTISVTPGTATIARYATQAFTAVATLSDNTTLNITDYVTWLSSVPATASVSNANGSRGVATGLASGTVSITAVRGSVTGNASLTVQ